MLGSWHLNLSICSWHKANYNCFVFSGTFCTKLCAKLIVRNSSAQSKLASCPPAAPAAAAGASPILPSVCTRRWPLRLPEVPPPLLFLLHLLVQHRDDCLNVLAPGLPKQGAHRIHGCFPALFTISVPVMLEANKQHEAMSLNERLSSLETPTVAQPSWMGTPLSSKKTLVRAKPCF